jgi:hypothetical protein
VVLAAAKDAVPCDLDPVAVAVHERNDAEAAHAEQEPSEPTSAQGGKCTGEGRQEERNLGKAKSFEGMRLDG